MKSLLIATVVISLLFLISCSDKSPTIIQNYIQFDIVKLQNMRDSFLLHEPAHYSFNYSSLGFTPIRYKVTIVNHVVSSIQSDTTQYFLPSFTNYYDSQLVSIISKFDEITESYYQSNNEYVSKQNVYLTGISVAYDTARYFPSSCQYSYFIPSNVAWDGNPFWSIDSFQILP
jgi:hypothetical protein